MNPVRLFVLALVAGTAGAPAAAQPAKDTDGDPLPDGAAARVGTTRMVKPGDPYEWASAVLTPDGKFLLSPVPGGAVARIDVATGRTVGTIGGAVAARTGRETLYLSADGTRGASALGNVVTAWDARTGEVVSRIERPRAFGRAAVAFSADGSTLALGAPRGARRPVAGAEPPTVLVWDYGAGKRRLDIEVAADGSAFVALSADGKTLATWGTDEPPHPADPLDGRVRFWNASTGKPLGTLIVRGARVASVCFPPGGGLVAVGDERGGVILTDPKTGRELKRFAAAAPLAPTLAFSPDGGVLAAGSPDGTVRRWDAGTGATLDTTKCPVRVTHSPVGMAFTGGDRLVAWAFEGPRWPAEGVRAVVWEVPSGKPLSPVADHATAIHSLTFTPDGTELLTPGPAWTVFRWDVRTGRKLGTVTLALPPGVEGTGWDRVQLFPNGAPAVAIGSQPRYVHDPRTGKLLHEYGTKGRFEKVFADASGTLLLGPFVPGKPFRPWAATVREAATDETLCQIEFPSQLFYAPPVRTPDRNGLIFPHYVGSERGTDYKLLVCLWDLKTGKKLGEVTEPAGARFQAVASGPDGKTAFLGDVENGLRVLDFTTGKGRRIDTDGLIPCAGPVAAPDGKRFAVGLCDRPDAPRVNEVRVYDGATVRLLKTFRGHEGRVTALAFAPDGKTLASGSADTTVLVWDLAAGAVPK